MTPRLLYTQPLTFAMTGWALVACLVSVEGCTNSPPSARRSNGDTATNAVRAPGNSRPATDVEATPGLRVLIDSLGRMRGRFIQSPGGAWTFSPEPVGVVRAFAAHGDSAVAALVECLGDTTKASATVRDEPIVRGIMCVEILRRIAYPTEFEDADSGWAGSVFPTSSASDLVRAQEAWRRVVRLKRYRLS